MKKIFLLIIFSFTLNSCSFDQQGFEFENFENTPVWDLAKAVRDNDVDEIDEILKTNKVDINYKDPICQQTLLTLAIVNEKKESFLELLKLGANPNIILGNNHETSAITEAIKHQKKCQLFYIENLLKYKANPNLEIISKDGYYPDFYPLFTAIDKGVNGDECTDVLELLIRYGADINCCSPKPMDKRINCEGVIAECLINQSMVFLRYFVVEKKIKIPKIAYISHTISGTTQEVFTLAEILNTKEYSFYDFVQDGEKVDRSANRKIRNEILEYLKKTRQE